MIDFITPYEPLATEPPYSHSRYRRLRKLSMLFSSALIGWVRLQQRKQEHHGWNQDQ